MPNETLDLPVENKEKIPPEEIEEIGETALEAVPVKIDSDPSRLIHEEFPSVSPRPGERPGYGHYDEMLPRETLLTQTHEVIERPSKISRLRQRLGRSTVLPQVDSSNLPEAEDSSLERITDLEPGIALGANPDSPNHETETVGAESDDFSEEEKALLSPYTAKSERGPSGSQKVTLENGVEGLWRYKGRHLERAAYLVSKALNFDLVPTTVIRRNSEDTIDGTFQEWAPDAINFEDIERDWIPNSEGTRTIAELTANTNLYDQLYMLGILDYCVWHTDGHDKNTLVTTDGKLQAVDFEHAFADTEYSGRRFKSLVEFYGDSAPEEVVECAIRFLENESVQQNLLDQIQKLMRPEEAEACLARIKYAMELLATKGKIESGTDFSEYSPEPTRVI